ncbi:hypothetical protein SSBR45G_39020 [Bradyrhizobium sp. SSBR45G]|nr:hypothetical protein SSBR45G_39020 [Bradyrhizobium sp. SSBR45G]GLH85316.1 hypothetical protein SSBR45R_27760 [Bradyrhizobium sp. SSBR45R]
MPPIYIRRIQAKGAEGLVNEVIDGQQRVSAVLDYIDGKYRLSKNLSSDWAGRAYRDLSPTHRQAITNHSFSTEIFVGITDLEVLEIFARLNTYSVPLNSQELRNGKYFGSFKQSMYSLALEHLEFWRRQNIFSERSIARMLEAELTSELSIALFDGMQDKKKSIDEFYGKFEEEYPARLQNEKRFREIIDEINETFDQGIGDTQFSRAPLFYTLFCVVAHRRFGLPKCSFATPKKSLNAAERADLSDAVRRLSDAIEKAKEGDAIPNSLQTFVAASLTQTDNIKPRQDRFRVLYHRAFPS